MPQAVTGLLESRKALMVLAVFIVLATMVSLGKLGPEFLQRFLDVVMPTWLGAHAFEQGAKAYAEAKRPSTPPAPG